MFRKILAIPMILILAALGGCGGTNMVLKPEAVNQVKSVALLSIPEPPYRIINLGSPVGGLGVIGAITIAVNGKEAVKSIEGVTTENNFVFGNQLTSEIATQLEKSGFKVNIINVERAENELFEDYSGINTEGADALIDIVVSNAGYVTEHFMFSPEWRPEARAMISMHATSNSDVIYQETLMHGYHNPIMSGTDLEAAEEYKFDNKEAIFEAGDKVVLAGLQDAINSIASHIATQLRKQN